MTSFSMVLSILLPFHLYAIVFCSNGKSLVTQICKSVCPGCAPCVENKTSFPTHSTYLTIKHMLVHQYVLITFRTPMTLVLCALISMQKWKSLAYPFYNTSLVLGIHSRMCTNFPKQLTSIPKSFNIGSSREDPHQPSSLLTFNLFNVF